MGVQDREYMRADRDDRPSAEQSWQHYEDRQRVTAFSYVVVGLLAVLTVAVVVFVAAWFWPAKVVFPDLGEQPRVQRIVVQPQPSPARPIVNPRKEPALSGCVRSAKGCKCFDPKGRPIEVELDQCKASSAAI